MYCSFGISNVGQAFWYIWGIRSMQLWCHCCRVVFHFTGYFAMKRLSPKIFGVLLSASPIISALAGWFILGENLNLYQMIVSIIMVSCRVLLLFLSKYRRCSNMCRLGLVIESWSRAVHLIAMIYNPIYRSRLMPRWTASILLQWNWLYTLNP